MNLRTCAQAAYSGGSSDIEFWSRGLHPGTRSTPLMVRSAGSNLRVVGCSTAAAHLLVRRRWQLVVPRVAQYGVDDDNLSRFLNAARWMLDRGADPHLVAPASCSGIVSLRYDAKESSIEV